MYIWQHIIIRVVSILVPVSESASSTTRNADIRIGKYASVYTDPIPGDLLAAKWYPATLPVSLLV